MLFTLLFFLSNLGGFGCSLPAYYLRESISLFWVLGYAEYKNDTKLWEFSIARLLNTAAAYKAVFYGNNIFVNYLP